MMFFLKQYFTACHCHVVHQDNKSIKVELTEEIDRAIMNRPFYWHYKDKLNEQGQPLTITFHTEETGEPLRQFEEYVSFGSPRFHQLLNHAKKQSSFVRLYEQCSAEKPVKLEPWLVVHFLISYEGNGKKERMESMALHLITGTIQRNFLSKINELPFDHTIPSFHYVLSPFIKPLSGLKRLQQFLVRELEQEQHDWAEKAKQEQEKELKLLHAFYADEPEENEAFEREKEAIIRRFDPVIRISVWNGGLFYLSNRQFH